MWLINVVGLELSMEIMGIRYCMERSTIVLSYCFFYLQLLNTQLYHVQEYFPIHLLVSHLAHLA